MSGEEHTLMAELAKIFEEDDTCCSAKAQQAPAASAQQSLACGYAPLTQQPCSHVHASKACTISQDDPFLLPGDETTWLLDEWAWDPFSLSAAPKGQLQQQPDSKRRKLQDGVAQPAHVSTCSAMPAAAFNPSLQGAACSTHARERKAAGDPLASSCCTFRMPSMHLPTTAMANLDALQQHQQCAASAGQASWQATGMQPDMSWNSPAGGVLSPGTLPPMLGNSAVSLPLVGHSAVNAAPGPQHPLTLAGMLDATSQAASMLPLQQQYSLHNSLGSSVPPASPAATMMSPAAVQAAAAVASANMGTAAPGPGAMTTKTFMSMSQPGMPSAPAVHLQPPAARPGSFSTTATMPDVTLAAAADSGDESDADAPGPGAKLNANSAAARKQGSLPPATYTGNMEDVVTLSDTCVDEASRMRCQVAGCGKDLSGLKEYHQRYRICEVHIKLPQVLKDGRLQRFCQQCGRFHDLSAFDAGRKSCREQLSKHNARRRRRAQMESQKAKALEQLSSAVPVAGIAAAGAGEPPNGGGSAAAALLPMDTAGLACNDVGRLLSALMQNPAQLAALRLLLGVQTHPALPPLQPFTPEPALSVGSGGVAGGDAGAELLSAPPTYGLAREVVDGRGVWTPNFESDHQVLRISMKLFNRTPSDLPPDLRQHVTSWLSSMPSGLSGAIRPGCVFLTLQLLLDTATYQDALRRGLASLLRHLRTATGCTFWHEGVYVVQLAGEMALLVGGRVTAYHRQPTSTAPQEEVCVEATTPCTQAAACCGTMSARRTYPQTTSLAQLCVPAHTGTGVHSVAVQLSGSHVDKADVELIVRQGSTQLRQSLRTHTQADGQKVFIGEVPLAPLASTAPADQAVGCGMVWLEVQRGAWLGPAHPLLVVDDPALAAEVQQLTDPACKAQLSPIAKQMLLVDLGMVLAHTSSTADCFQGVAHHHVARKARQLLLFACDMGWAAVAARVLPLATANCACAQEVIQAVHASSASPPGAQHVSNEGTTSDGPSGCSQRSPSSSEASNAPTLHDEHAPAAAVGADKQGGLSLLHRVVRSGNLTLLQGVLHWGQVSGYKWRADRNGPGGVTPLHLAALQEDPRVLLALLDYAPPGAFTALQAQDGTTPFHLAFQMGHFTLDCLASQLHKEQLLPESALDAGPAGRGVAGMDMAPVVKAAIAAIQSLNGGLEVQPEVFAASASGAELDPCGRCQCRLPPVMLSIAAACVACGERVPCLGGLSSYHSSHNQAHTASSICSEAKQRSVPGHDTMHCAGCSTAQLLEHSMRDPVQRPATGSLIGRKRPQGWTTALNTDLPAVADSANNCAGYGVAYQDACSNNDHDQALLPGLHACVHQHGSVYSVTAMCQGCHANRVLEVV